MMLTATRLFNVITACSILLIPLLIAVWIRSYHVADRFRMVSFRNYGWYFIRKESILEAGLGGIGFYCDWDASPGSAPSPPDVWDQEIINHPYEGWQDPRYPYRMDPHGYGGGDPWRRRMPIAGFYFQDVEGGGGWMRQVTVPVWSMIVVCWLSPAAWVARWFWQTKARREGYCRVCGYDLRATPDRCPECGTITTKTGAVSS
jgi:hypothetical protein